MEERRKEGMKERRMKERRNDGMKERKKKKERKKNERKKKRKKGAIDIRLILQFTRVLVLYR